MCSLVASQMAPLLACSAAAAAADVAACKSRQCVYFSSIFRLLICFLSLSLSLFLFQLTLHTTHTWTLFFPLFLSLTKHLAAVHGEWWPSIATAVFTVCLCVCAPSPHLMAINIVVSVCVAYGVLLRPSSSVGDAIVVVVSEHSISI